MARAPQAIRDAQTTIVVGVGGAVASGIVGDSFHGYGYHRARNEVLRGDYSAVLDLDLAGPGDAASALDISLPPDQMIAVTARLRDAAVRDDPRLYALREFAGTLDGRTTFNRDLSNGVEGFAVWDDSHLWHIHLSGYRQYADDPDAWRAIASVFTDTAITGGAALGNTPPTSEDELTNEEKVLLAGIAENAAEARRLAGIAVDQTTDQAKNASIAYVLRTEGVSGSGDVSKLAEALAAKLPASGGVSTDQVKAALLAAFADIGASA